MVRRMTALPLFSGEVPVPVSFSKIYVTADVARFYAERLPPEPDESSNPRQ
jgi:hypothetical protein